MKNFLILFLLLNLISCGEFDNFDVKYGNQRASDSIKESKKNKVFIQECKIIRMERKRRRIDSVWLEKNWTRTRDKRTQILKGYQFVYHFKDDSSFDGFITDFVLRINDKALSGYGNNAIYQLENMNQLSDTIVAVFEYENNFTDSIICSCDR